METALENIIEFADKAHGEQKESIPYPKLNRRSRKSKELIRLEKTSPDAQTIKYADIIDSSKEIIEHDPDFARGFLFECNSNLKKMD